MGNFRLKKVGGAVFRVGAVFRYYTVYVIVIFMLLVILKYYSVLNEIRVSPSDRP